FFSLFMYLVFFFFQAEDGIRDLTVTGVQTCALPISVFLGGDQGAGCAVVEGRGVTGGDTAALPEDRAQLRQALGRGVGARPLVEIGRASCRERVEISGGAV